MIIDEASQAKEIEVLQSIRHASQVVMIGDQKQLGPVYKGQIEGPDSMFSRIIQGGYPYIMLNQQYRMQGKILKIPNQLFYNNEIINKYGPPKGLPLIIKKVPLLFIDHEF